MKVEQIYTGCLAQGAYYIESEGEVAIIDPLRETTPYIERAQASNAKIKYIFETHFHADFVSGHLDLAQKTGATIVYGKNAEADFEFHKAQDQEEFTLGKVKIKALHTPGHTLESTTYLLVDEAGNDHAIFTGDTLFIGDVGRPDLAVKSDLSQEDLAGLLFDSLRNQLMPLADEVVVYPGHGAGSACGKNMSKETFDTLGNQKKNNYALRESMTKEEFIREVTTGLTTPPQYFPKNVLLNKQGSIGLDQVMQSGLQALSPEAFQQVVRNEGALILDTRAPQVFKDAFIPKSINIGLDGSFAPWVGALIQDLNQPIVFIAEEGREKEVVTRLSRVGYDHTLGFLKGGIQAWKDAGNRVDSIVSIPATEFKTRLSEGIQVLDVRKESEFTAEHIDYDAVKNLPLDFMNEHMNELNPNDTYYIHCAGGYRSMIFTSILKARGFDQVIDVAGGMKAIRESAIDLTAFACPNS
ncbi:MAG: MBL fold metallo-hydrolase [Flammeovirgaceae bacterium]